MTTFEITMHYIRDVCVVGASLIIVLLFCVEVGRASQSAIWRCPVCCLFCCAVSLLLLLLAGVAAASHSRCLCLFL